MGLYKLCSHKGRLRDRCAHVWWGSFRGVRVSLSKWANRDVTLKTDAQAVLEDVRAAIRAGTFDPRGQVVREITPMTFREFAEIYKERHAVAKGQSLARTIDWRLHVGLRAHSCPRSTSDAMAPATGDTSSLRLSPAATLAVSRPSLAVGNDQSRSVYPAARLLHSEPHARLGSRQAWWGQSWPHTAVHGTSAMLTSSTI